MYHTFLREKKMIQAFYAKEQSIDLPVFMNILECLQHAESFKRVQLAYNKDRFAMFKVTDITDTINFLNSQEVVQYTEEELFISASLLAEEENIAEFIKEHLYKTKQRDLLTRSGWIVEFARPYAKDMFIIHNIDGDGLNEIVTINRDTGEVHNVGFEFTEHRVSMDVNLRVDTHINTDNTEEFGCIMCTAFANLLYEMYEVGSYVTMKRTISAYVECAELCGFLSIFPICVDRIDQRVIQVTPDGKAVFMDLNEMNKDEKIDAIYDYCMVAMDGVMCKEYVGKWVVS
jgi:hypothetical protein